MRFCGKEVTLSRVSIKKAQHPTSRSFLFEKKFLYIIELFTGSYRNIYCGYIKKAEKNLEVNRKGLTFAHAFRERGAVMEKRGIFFGE